MNKDGITVNRQRPINLDLTSLSFPPMAIASILHRISGILIFLLLPFLLYLFCLSLQSASSFSQLQKLLMNTPVKVGLWMVSSALAYHIIAGIRHITLDMGFGESLQVAKRSALIVILLGVVITIFLGVWIW